MCGGIASVTAVGFMTGCLVHLHGSESYHRDCFEFADLPQLPVDDWDKQLHGVCTEIGLRMTQ
jgi:hypothetical protein